MRVLLTWFLFFDRAVVLIGVWLGEDQRTENIEIGLEYVLKLYQLLHIR